MSTIGLFTIGVLVTLILAAAMALLIYAAILDGRDAAARKAADREPPAPAPGTNIQGEDLAISNNGAVRIDSARLVSGDVEASNGVIHVIDRVLLPARIGKEYRR